ncbi:hypothetical protein EUGRSUZ_G01797 [Eucalyptus grandis]|uniref:Uncharacterized protein n=2 Tax=Eucalyptus grandis TaxID=71139 RepID=A0ACC3K4E4_EUCGR|nr:hypothetical protein EUGRSUZ_G01797 [Eucalyptus grandis]
MLLGPPSMEILRTEGEEDIIAAKLQNLKDASRSRAIRSRGCCFSKEQWEGYLEGRALEKSHSGKLQVLSEYNLEIVIGGITVDLACTS